ncbi:MAG: PEP-CTERM sorting domain-containing protein [Armatimonadetes bacterium]|nr:PEP-CTERM sorting domain-containing protein [Armatimonadota bacterium]
MNYSRGLQAGAIALALAATSPATITSYNDYLATAEAYQYDNYQLYDSYTSTTPINFSDPYTVNNVFGDSLSTMINASTATVYASSSYIHMQGHFAGQCTMQFGHANGTTPLSEAYMFHELLFTVDVPTLVTISASNTYTYGGGAFTTTNYLYIDGAVQNAAIDGIHQVTVSAGSHAAYYEGFTQCYYAGSGSDYGYTFLSADYDLQVGDPRSVPEPASMCAMGLGVLSLIRRKRIKS